MHPNSAFRFDSRAAHEALIAEVGFGMIIAATPTGLRVAHTPLVVANEGAIRFHLAKANPITPHLDGASILALVNGPDGYISPRWYPAKGEVPTWNYIALEMSGTAAQLPLEGLADLLTRIGAQHEPRLPGGPQWQPEDVPADRWDKLIGAITGFELTITDWRPTYKLSQNKPEATRLTVADGLASAGNAALAQAMRQQGA